MDLLDILNTLSSNNTSLNGTQINIMNTTLGKLTPTTAVYDEITEDDGPSAEEDSVHAILMHYIEYRVSRYVGIYGYPLVTFLGTVGNVLSFMVMKRKSMRNNSTCFYMSVLAVGDTVVLYFGCLRRWVTYQYNWDIINYSSAGCKIFSILNYWGFDFAVWVLVAMTIDRFIALRWPLRSIIYATVSRAKKTSVLIALLLLPVNIHFLWTVDLSEDDNCQPKDDIYRHFIENEWVWIDASLYSFVPFFLLLVFNVLIIFDNRKAIARQRVLKGSMVTRREAGKGKHIATGNQRLTKMLLAVSATFLVMSAPKVILLIIRPHVFIFADENGINWMAFANYTLTAALLNILTYGSHSINFFLYCITGQKFRRELKKCMCCGRKLTQPRKISTIKIEDNDHIGVVSSSTSTTHL